MSENLPDLDALWNYSQPAETEKKFREILAATPETETPYRLQLLTQIARTQGLQRQFTAAHHTLDAVSAAQSSDEVVNIRYLLERGRVFNSSGEKDTALALFLQAYELARTAKLDDYAIDAAHMLAIAAPPDQQLDWNLKALNLVEHTTDAKAKKWAGSLYNNIGWTYHDSGDYEKALGIFEKALVWRTEQQQPREIRIAVWCVARTLRSLGRVELALQHQYTLLAEYEQISEKDGYVYEEIAECLLLLNRAEEAKPYCAAAYEELAKDTWLVAHEAARLERLKMLAFGNR